MQHRVYIILGGFFGWDGMLTSAGMYGLASMIRKQLDAKVAVYNWGRNVAKRIDEQIRTQPKDSPTTVIGYSGGGWKLMEIGEPVDLAVGYDPSPRWKIDPLPPLGSNFRSAIYYHCTRPMFFGFGGAKWKGMQVKMQPMPSETHMTIQSNLELHQLTIKAIKGCV